MQFFGPPSVVKLIARRDVKGLIRALDSRDERIRWDAAWALSRMGADAVEPLAAVLNHSSSRVRETATWALGTMGAPVIDRLAQALRDASSDVRKVAAEALGQIPKLQAIRVLESSLRDDDPAVRRTAAESLDKVGWSPFADAIGAAYWAAVGNWDRVAAIGAPALEVLVNGLNCEDPATRILIAEALGEIGDAAAVEALVATLDSSDLYLFGAVTEALAKIGSSRAVRALVVAALQDSEPKARANAIEALAKVGRPAVEPLVTFLSDGNPEVVAAAVNALDLVGWCPTADVEGAIYLAHKGEWELCAKIGPAGVEVLLDHLSDPQAEVRAAVVRALGLAGDASSVQPLMKLASADSDPRVREAAAETVVRMGSVAVDPLLKVLKHGGPGLRISAVGILSRIGDVKAVTPLTKATLDDTDESVREESGQALVRMGAAAIQPLVAILGGDEIEHRLVATWALGEIGGFRALAPLVRALKDENPILRSAAAEALGALGDTRAIAALDSALDDPDAGVRDDAAKALDRLADWNVGVLVNAG